jgi:hypothetical protein
MTANNFTAFTYGKLKIEKFGHYHGIVLFEQAKSEIDALLTMPNGRFKLEELFGDKLFTAEEAIIAVIFLALDNANDNGRETLYKLFSEAYADNPMVLNDLNTVASDFPALLKAIPYRAYLQTDHWKDVRKGALARADGRCQVCNSKENLHTHHRTYARRGEEHPADVIVLCADCHRTFHENGKLTRGDK